MPKTAALSLRVEPSLKEAIERLALKDRRRPVAAYIEMLLIDHCVDKGELKPEEGKD